MKKIVILMMLMISALGFSQKNLIDSTEVYRIMPDGDLILTIYDFDDVGRLMDGQSRIYNTNKFILKIYFKEEEDGMLISRVYTSDFSKNKTKWVL